LKKEALDCTLSRTHFWRGYGPVIRQTTEWMNEWISYLLYRLCMCSLFYSFKVIPAE
jgi:hypothetical protein